MPALELGLNFQRAAKDNAIPPALSPASRQESTHSSGLLYSEPNGTSPVHLQGDRTPPPRMCKPAHVQREVSSYDNLFLADFDGGSRASSLPISHPEAARMFPAHERTTSHLTNPPPATRENNVYVKFFSADLDDEGLADMFKPCGRVLSSKVLRYHDGRSKQVGFVQMASHEEAVEACKLHNKEVGGARQLHVALAMAKDERQRAFQARREQRRAAETASLLLNSGHALHGHALGGPSALFAPGLALNSLAAQAQINALISALTMGTASPTTPLSPQGTRSGMTSPDSVNNLMQGLGSLRLAGASPNGTYSPNGPYNASGTYSPNGTYTAYNGGLPLHRSHSSPYREAEHRSHGSPYSYGSPSRPYGGQGSPFEGQKGQRSPFDFGGSNSPFGDGFLGPSQPLGTPQSLGGSYSQDTGPLVNDLVHMLVRQQQGGAPEAGFPQMMRPQPSLSTASPHYLGDPSVQYPFLL